MKMITDSKTQLAYFNFLKSRIFKIIPLLEERIIATGYVVGYDWHFCHTVLWKFLY